MAHDLASDPGLPVDSPSKSYWQEPPHRLSSHQSDQLPSHADVVIIGSGITGTSVAHYLLQQSPPLSVTMLEARTIVSGATGRNGGHVLDVPFADFEDLKAHVGIEEAWRISRFRMGHLKAIEAMVKSLGPEKASETQFRRVEAVCTLFDATAWDSWCTRRESWLKAFPEYREQCQAVEGAEAVQKRFGIVNAAGAITMPAGAMWPYRLVTAVLEHLLEKYEHFSLEANTPAKSISDSGNHTHPYAIATSRGTILASQVVHATNGHAAHLLPALRGKIVPVRGQMTVQTLADSVPSETRSNSWSLNYGGGDFDYMTQAPTTKGEYLLGGGLKKAIDGGTADIGCTDDAGTSEPALKHLSRVLPRTFDFAKASKVQQQWTGIMGFTSDDLPIVGKIPVSLGSIAEKQCKGQGSEWIAAGFCGHGMVYCWLSGQALAQMLLGKDSGDNFPASFACSKRRIDKLNSEHILS